MNIAGENIKYLGRELTEVLLLLPTKEQSAVLILYFEHQILLEERELLRNKLFYERPPITTWFLKKIFAITPSFWNADKKAIRHNTGEALNSSMEIINQLNLIKDEKLTLEQLFPE